ncbi:jg4087 [Pararge aegeria aegeria]|uniref:Jg4087 protein n=1 Tax=Pararge aegeria aegeria TaxID=348720 RepID=A0A8S4RVQ7_9NEOP|nr:jg4087 [Pararge aegeria aegeria]
MQRLPATRSMSSVHLVGGRPMLRIPVRGCHSSTLGPQRPSFLRTMCPVHCHFSTTANQLAAPLPRDPKITRPYPLRITEGARGTQGAPANPRTYLRRVMDSPHPLPGIKGAGGVHEQDSCARYSYE